MAVTIKKSTKNIGKHYIISKNGSPRYWTLTKAEAEKIASKMKKKK